MPGRKYQAGSASYQYGFGGKRRDNEMYGEGNAYDFEARIFDPRIVRWLSVDPLSGDYPHQSPYVAMSNDLINRIDPSGMGDYYGKDGKHLGSDGKTIKGKNGKLIGDDKAYTSSKSIIDEYTKDGVTDWDKVLANSGTSELGVSNSTLGKFANSIARESSGDMEESYALGSAIKNLATYKNKDILSTLKTQGIFGYNGNTNYSNTEYSLEAAINALDGGTDYSNGAIKWDGFDLAARGFNHPKARKEGGIEISELHFNAFKAAWPDADIKAFSGGSYTSFASNFSSGIHIATERANAGRCLYKSTAVHGKTIFWGLNRDPIITRTSYYPVIYNPNTFPGFLFNGRPVLREYKSQIHLNAGFHGWGDYK